MFLFLTIQIYSQRPNGGGRKFETPSIVGRINGEVQDSSTSKPVEYAVIELLSLENKQVNGTIADENGKFSLPEVKTGKYKLKISFLGYKDKLIPMIETTLKDPDLQLGKIKLNPQNVMIGEVQVVDQRSAIETQVDKIVFNVTNDPTLAGGDAQDVLRKVPMVSVDMDGNVALRGSQRVKILLNGKPSSMFSDNVGEALQMFPAEEIQKVEVLTSPGAKYDAEGTAGIINIVTRKSIMEGLNGGISGFGGNRMENGNARIAYGKSRFGINARIGSRYSLPTISSVEFFRENTTPAGKSTLTQNGNTDVSRYGVNGVVGAFYDINAFNSINTSFRVHGHGNKSDGTLTSVFSDPTLNYIRTSTNHSNDMALDWNGDYTKKFASNQDKKLIIAFQLENDFNKNKNNKSFDINKVGESNINNGLNREFTAQVDYTQPMSKTWKIETGAKSIFRNVTSDFTRTLNINGKDTIDAANSDVFHYTQNVYAAYLSTTIVLPGMLSVMPGLRFESTAIGGHYDIFNNKFSNNYNNFFPSVTIAKKFKNFSSVKLSYDSRISRPATSNINPYIDNTDPQNVNYGNPALKPELTNNYEIGYSKFFKGSTLNFSLYYRDTRDVINSFMFIVDSSNVSNTTYKNIGTTQAYGFNAFASTTLWKIWELRGNVDLNQFEIKGTNLSENLTNSGLKYRFSLGSNLRFAKSWIVEMWGFFNSPEFTLQGQNPSFSMFSIGLQKEFWNKKAKIGLRVANPFAPDRIFLTKYSGTNFSQSNKLSVPFRALGISFSYDFGKLNFKERKDVINNADQKSNQNGDDGQ